MHLSPRRPNAFSMLLLLLVLISCAAPRPAASQPLESRQGAYELQVLVDGRPVRTFAHDGETHVLGHAGDRYLLRVLNRSGRRVEAVVSVDGLDVIDGQPADFSTKRGYLVPAYGHVDIEGWRVSAREAAAFRFGAVSESYAAKTGNARNVGVIGVAVFPERERPRPNLYVPPALPRVPVPDYAPSTGSSDGARESRGNGSRRSGGSARPVPSASASAPDRATRAPASAPASAERGRDEAAPPAAEAKAEAEAAPRARAGLGTEFGEAVRSEIQHVEFVRANERRPATILGVRYNDRPGLIALGIDVDEPSERTLRGTANPFPLSQRYATPPADWQRF